MAWDLIITAWPADLTDEVMLKIVHCGEAGGSTYTFPLTPSQAKDLCAKVQDALGVESGDGSCKSAGLG
jgi:hypothetical protein